MVHPVVIIAPYCDGSDVGESWAAHQWVEAIGREIPVTLLTMKRRGRPAPSSQLPHVEVVEWPEITLPTKFERVINMLKPGYIPFYFRARRWLLESLADERKFSIVHQLSPFALRYPSPAAGLGVPLILGPLAGSLETPAGFQEECGNVPLFVRLRAMDKFRLQRDPVLRHTFSSADLVIGVAPYVAETLANVPIKRFEVCSETGIHDVPIPQVPKNRSKDKIRLLHVGRGVRTKGLRDCVRSMAHLADLPEINLMSAGQGREIELCRAEAEQLGGSDRVKFLGQVPRRRVEELYQDSDIFFFPSFREPSGSVVFESMRHGLPIVTARYGGPNYVVNDDCGIRVSPNNPEQYSRELAEAIRRLIKSDGYVDRLSAGARRRMSEIGLWSVRVDWMLGQYEQLLRTRH